MIIKMTQQLVFIQVTNGTFLKKWKTLNHVVTLSILEKQNM